MEITFDRISNGSVRSMLECLVIDLEKLSNTNDISDDMWVQLIKEMFKDNFFIDRIGRSIHNISLSFFNNVNNFSSISIFGKYLIRSIQMEYDKEIGELINSIIDNADDNFKIGFFGAYPSNSISSISIGAL